MSPPAARRAAPWLLLALMVQRALELRHARANERWMRERGAVEHGREHYPLFFALHGGWLLGMALESRRARRPLRPFALAALLLAQPLRYWVMLSLGRRWNTRILVLPGGARVRRGPFRYLQHPNYAVVALELAAAPLALRAPRTALLASVLNAALLLGVRIPAEERALRIYGDSGAAGGDGAGGDGAGGDDVRRATHRSGTR